MKRIAKLSLLIAAILSVFYITPSRAATIDITDASIVGTVDWYKTNTYVLEGFVFVETNEVLNIEAGTVIKGKPGQGAAASALIVARGGKIFANGTAAEPVIFTAEADDVADPFDFAPSDRGLWGGLIVLGNATLNSPIASGIPITDNIEGIPVEELRGIFGGSDDTDSSGSLRYISIRHGGSNIGANNEINGLTLGAVGSGTIIEYVEVYANLDDGIEFFGGTAQVKYAAISFCGDDSFDYDQGFRGKGQFWFTIADSDADNGGEHDGDIDDFTKLPLSNPTIYNATYLGNGAASGVSHRALRIRENAAGVYANSIFADYGGSEGGSANGIQIDDTSTNQLALGNLSIHDNIWWGFGAGNTAANIANGNAQILFTDSARNNEIVDPMLRGLSRDGDMGLDPRPFPGSPALSTADLPPIDGFFTATSYQGAFGNNLWLKGWTILDQSGFIGEISAPGGIVEVFDEDIDGEVVWTADNTYVLNGFVFVDDGETLTIQAGTVVKGKPGQGAAASALIVARGGKIFAEGTPRSPVIFTAEADDVTDPFDFGPSDRGLWGGLIILGRATLNSPVASGTPVTDNVEGIPVEEPRGIYGGDDDDDSSGVLRYVSVRHGGSNIGANNEINGVTFGAVGRGTVVEFVEVYANLDDGFEFFGGTVNTRNLSVAFCGDDSFDYDQGFRGKGQFWFSIADPDADNGGEHDGDIDDFTKLPLSNPTIYNATYIGNGVSSGISHRALRIRENAAGQYVNSIFTDFGGSEGGQANAILIDDSSTNQLALGNLNLHDNYWWSFGAGTDPTNLANANARVLFTDPARNNQIADPMLLGISRDGDGTLDPRLSSGSPAWSVASAPMDGFFKPAPYAGAFGSDLWLRHWTILDQAGFIPHAVTVVDVTDADIVGDTTWSANNVYVLNGFVFVEDGETLTIEPGTIVKGKPGQGASASALIVARGGKIFAEGTPNSPIIFTAEDDDVSDPFDFGLADRGLWGGLIVLGRATLNSPVASGAPITDNIEGIPVEEARGIFGGSDDADSSGVIRYVSIRHGGSNIGANNEINGLTLGAVGSGTTVEFVEIVANLDDGVEFFGGTVNTKYILVAFCGDDSFDYDQGFRGKGQFWFTIADTDADNGGEHDGDIDDFTKSPLSNPTIFNATYLGNGASSGVSHRALRIRENAAGVYANSIFSDYGGAGGGLANGIQIDDSSTNQLALGNLNIHDNLWWGFGAGNTANNIANGNAMILFTDASRNNDITDPQLLGISRDFDRGLDPRPGASSPAWSPAITAPDDGFFVQAPYQGAFGDQNWASDWTFMSHVEILSPQGGGNPLRVVTPVGPLAPILAIVQNGSDVEISFDSQSGVSYQLQSASSAGNPTSWIDDGVPVDGDGSTITITRSIAGAMIYQVVAQ